MLSYVAPAVTVEEADAYATARGLTAWTGNEAAKAAALRRGQDYIAREFNGRWLEEWTDAPDVVKFAIVEAAVAEIVKPGGLSPVVTPGEAKALVGVGSLRWEPARLASGVDGFKPVLTAIEAMLAPLVTGRSTGFLGRA